MEGILIAVLVIAIPIILFPAALIWYINIGGIVHAMREARTHQKRATPVPETTK